MNTELNLFVLRVILLISIALLPLNIGLSLLGLLSIILIFSVKNIIAYSTFGFNKKVITLIFQKVKNDIKSLLSFNSKKRMKENNKKGEDFKGEITSVILTKNSEKTLKRCIKSLKEQKVDLNEIIVVDSNSKDKTLEIAKSFENVRIIKNIPDGIPLARNIGLEESNTSLVLFTDSDCIYNEETVEKLYKKFDTKTGLVYGSYRYDKENIMGKYANKLNDDVFAPCGISLLRKEYAMEVNGFDESLRNSEDWDIAYKLLKNGYDVKESNATCKHDVENSWKNFLTDRSYYRYGELQFFRKHLHVPLQVSLETLMPLSFLLIVSRNILLLSILYFIIILTQKYYVITKKTDNIKDIFILYITLPLYQIILFISGMIGSWEYYLKNL